MPPKRDRATGGDAVGGDVRARGFIGTGVVVLGVSGAAISSEQDHGYISGGAAGTASAIGTSGMIVPATLMLRAVSDA